MDVRATVEHLQQLGIKVHCLALGGMDLTSSAGRMTMQVLSAVAEFERDLIVERTQAGLQRARNEGKVLGRPFSLTARQRADIKKGLAAGISVSQLARDHGTSRQSIMRVRDGDRHCLL